MSEQRWWHVDKRLGSVMAGMPQAAHKPLQGGGEGIALPGLVFHQMVTGT